MSNLEIRGVRKDFGRVPVIHGVDLGVRDGEFIVFVGPSGCGKSTLLRMVAGLEDVTSGEIHIAGRDVTDLDPAQRGIAMVFQSYALYPHMTVRRNMGFGLKMGGMPADEVEKRVHSAAGVLKLDQLLDRKPRELSGGQRQRVAIGRAIVREPEVFLFDEPLSNLDAELRVQMRLEISKLHQQLKATMIYVTHDQVEAMTLADRIVVLRDGRVEQVGPPQLLYDEPDNAFVAGFIGSPKMNFLPAEVVGTGDHRATVAVAALGGQALEVVTRSSGLAVGARCTLGFRPEHTAVVAGGGAARVRLVETLGSVFHIYAEAGDEQVVAEGRVGALPAQEDEVSIQPEAARSFLFGEDGVRL